MSSSQRGTGVRNEQRLSSLRRLDLLDSADEPAFDRLTRLATRLLGVPMALVALIDADKQYITSSLGLPERWAAQRQIPLAHSFCQHIVEAGEPLIVADAPNHPLLADNPAISDLNMRAFLGVPLTTAAGMVLGSLCAIDTAAHEWRAEDVELMCDLAASAMAEIELRHDAIIREQTEAALYESNARFAGAFNHASIGMALVAPDGRWIQVNRALCELVGYTEHELLKLTFQQLTHPDDLNMSIAYQQQMLRGEIATCQLDKRYIHKDGRVIWVVLNLSLVRDVHGTPQYLVAQVQDNTRNQQHEWERQQLIAQLGEALDDQDRLLQQREEDLRRTEALYRVAAALSRTQELPTILHAVVEQAAQALPAHRTVLITVNMAARAVRQQLEGGPGAMHIPPLSFAELSEGLSGVVLRKHEPVRSPKGLPDPRESAAVQQRRRRDQAGSILVAPIQSQDKVFGTLTAINAPEQVDFTDGDMAFLATLANHAAVVIERTELLAELQHQATIDGLTQLLNRRSWFERSQHLAALAERNERPVSVLLLDIDHFKRINDTYGHNIGDVALRTIAGTLQRTLRRSDLLGRYGGEEFVVLLPEATLAAAARTAERIRRAVAEHPIEIQQLCLNLTISLGAATMQGSKLDLEALLKQADEALYAAKGAGRNRVQVYQG